MIALQSPQIRDIVTTTCAYPYRVWGFGEGIAMDGLLAAGGGGEWFATNLLTRWAHAAAPLREDPLAHVAPGAPLLELYSRTAEPGLLQRAVELAEVLEATERGQHAARIHRPDLAGWEHTVWVDCMHLDAPFLACLAQVTRDSHWSDVAVELLLGHARVLQDPGSGLFSHGFDDATGTANGVFWGRGQGWALLGLVDTARLLPHEEEIRDRLNMHIAALAATEANDLGRWHTVVDHPETYLEPSVSAFVAVGVARAVRARLVDHQFRGLAARALAATCAALDADGALVGVSDATPVGFSIEHYGSRPRGVFPWGQGPALLATLEEAVGD
jgi:unsaturated rhamnogalacturonyl hydrolase